MMKKHGTIDPFVMQPERVLTVKTDGTIEGTVEFICDRSKKGLLPPITSVHPDDSRCISYAGEYTFLKLEKVKWTLSYFGLTSSRTPAQISYSPSTDRDLITSHPNFLDFAGTQADPKNGAKFDVETGEFLGFMDPSFDEVFGVEYYLTPSTMVSRSYWQNSVPSTRRRMSIVTSIPGFSKPSDCKEFMLLDFPYRQLGPFYQVTEQYLGSGPKGFSRTIYDP